MRTDDWLSERLERPAFWVDPGDAAEDLPGHRREHAPAFYQARVPAERVDRVRELAGAGMHVVDATLTMRRDGAGASTDAADAQVAAARPDQREDVLRIAEHDYRVSRFHMDPAIPGEIAGRIKRDWLAAFFDGTRGERLLVAELDSRPAGFLGVVGRDRVSVIDAIAVREDARGRGVGRALVSALLADPGAGREAVEVGTQAANPAAVRFYERLGFATEGVRFVLHAHAEAP
jgi:ribosomal protein S18 acetylase RimI-like enzyme